MSFSALLDAVSKDVAKWRATDTSEPETIATATVPNPRGTHVWNYRRNEGKASLGSRAICSKCYENLEGCDRYVSLTMRSNVCISFLHYHTNCVPADCPLAIAPSSEPAP